MCALFDTLFARMQPDAMSPARRDAIAARWGGPPAKIFGAFFTELAAFARRGGKKG
jgi:hypothetical protein